MTANIHPLNALGDPTRRRIFEHIRLGPSSVNDLVATVSVSQPAVSQHLKVLREAQLVSVEKQGQQRIYQLNPNGLEELRQYVEGLWDDALQAFGEQAASLAKTETKTLGPAKSKSSARKQRGKSKDTEHKRTRKRRTK